MVIATGQRNADETDRDHAREWGTFQLPLIVAPTFDKGVSRVPQVSQRGRDFQTRQKSGS